MGSLDDESDLPGEAHFVGLLGDESDRAAFSDNSHAPLAEHLLFMGSEAFPDENEYSSFLSDHGGSSNAYTASDLTNYHFEVAPEYLAPALDRFAGFFTGPLLKASAVARELLAVDAEHAKNLQSDMWCVAGGGRLRGSGIAHRPVLALLQAPLPARQEHV